MSPSSFDASAASGAVHAAANQAGGGYPVGAPAAPHAGMSAAIELDLRAGTPLLWTPQGPRAPWSQVGPHLPLTRADLERTHQQVLALQEVYRQVFPELGADGVIASPLVPVERFAEAMGYDAPRFGQLLLKGDHALPVAGSIKARGGIYEVFSHALQLAEQHGLWRPGEDMAVLASPEARALFAQHTVAVGSTGNLGLSVGIAARALGFDAVVHMSRDAKQWKMDRLTERGVRVVQHDADYATAVEEAREQSAGDPRTYFVDDEGSKTLFLGYSAAAFELQDQLQAQGITVGPENPLFVYLPCGIGGAPGGIAFGLKHVFGDAAHCFVAEPVASPCVLVQLATGAADPSRSVYDYGLDNRTEADGLAVARASRLVPELIAPLLSGAFTATDDDMLRWVYQLQQSTGIEVEPSAIAGASGPHWIVDSCAGQDYQQAAGLSPSDMQRAVHVVWSTGGSFVPREQHDSFQARGRALLEQGRAA
jgi:D-serine dehydratase